MAIGTMIVCITTTTPSMADHIATRLASRAMGGGPANFWSESPVISADGLVLAFSSHASNLVPGDTNGKQDVFVYSHTNGAVGRISVSYALAEANGASSTPGISSSGRFVVFESTASNLVPADINGFGDVFIRDLYTGVIELVSLADSGKQANGASWTPSVSGDGRFVAFRSVASNLVESHTNGLSNVFVRDRQAARTFLVSLNSQGDQGDGWSGDPSISTDGRLIAFVSGATSLVADDTNEEFDVFVHDMSLHSTVRVSVASDGGEGGSRSIQPAMSGDGRFVAFTTFAALVADDVNLHADVYVRDLVSGETSLVSRQSSGAPFAGQSWFPAISYDGRFISFASLPSVLLRLPQQVWVHDTLEGVSRGASLSSDGDWADGDSFQTALSADGRYVAFGSFASNLVAEHDDDWFDVFLRDRGPVTCNSGVREEGVLSTRLHHGEDEVGGPGASAVHQASCEAARWGL